MVQNLLRSRFLDLVVGVHSEGEGDNFPDLANLRIDAVGFKTLIARVDQFIRLQTKDSSLIELGYLCPELVWLARDDDFELFERCDMATGRNLLLNLAQNEPTFLADCSGQDGAVQIQVQACRVVINRKRIYWEAFMADDTTVITDDVPIELLRGAWKLLAA